MALQNVKNMRCAKRWQGEGKMAVPKPKRFFSVDEYYRMAEAGILSADDRVELIEGEIVAMSPIGTNHIACVNRLNALLSPYLGQTAIVSLQNPLRLRKHAEPDPAVSSL